jgi:hypothetical protein
MGSKVRIYTKVRYTEEYSLKIVLVDVLAIEAVARTLRVGNIYCLSLRSGGSSAQRVMGGIEDGV